MTVNVTTMEAEQYALLELPPPVHSWIPYRYNFNELDFGAGTPWIVESVKGLLGFDGESSNVALASGPGSIPGLLVQSSKTVEITLKCDAKKGTDVEEKLALLHKHFYIPSRPYNIWVGDYLNRGYFTERSTALNYYRPGWSEGRVLYCRAKKLSVDSDYALATGFIEAQVQLEAPDPFSYGYHTHVISMEDGDSIEWTAEGNMPDGYPPYVRLHGPLLNPSIRRTYTDFYHPGGHTQKVSFALSYGGDIKVDFRNRSTDPMGATLVLSDDEFFAIKPGEQTLWYEGTGRCDFLTRAVWV